MAAIHALVLSALLAYQLTRYLPPNASKHAFFKETAQLILVKHFRFLG
jgi:hypothetical protein